MRRVLISLFAGGSLLARRRATRDLPLLVVWATLVTLAVLVSVAAPRFVGATIDAGAREAVAAAGARADLVAVTKVGAELSIREITTAPDEVGDLADQLADALPPGILSAYDGSTYSVVGPRSVVESSNAAVAIAMIVDPAALAVLEGTLPTDAPPPRDGPFPVAISASAAAAGGLGLGSVITVPADSSTQGRELPFEVVAIVEAVDETDPLWAETPDLFDVPVSDDGMVSVTPLATAAVVDEVSSAYVQPFQGTIRFHTDASRYDGDLLAQVTEEHRDLGANALSMTGSVSYTVGITTQFGSALEPFAAQSRAAIAQLSMIIAGALGVVASVLVLMSRLLVLRRASEFALERARGSSLAATVLRTVPQAVIVVAIAVGITLLVLPGVLGPFFAGIVVVALLADPVQSTISVLSTRTAKRAPANRQDRAVIATRRRTRRIALEATILALGVGALVALLARGLLQSTTDGIDPLLTATPLLVAAMVTVVVVRIYPLPVRAVAGLAARSPGIHGLVGSVRARRAIAVLPLLALTLAIGLTTTNAFLAETVSRGQVAASWQRVGADVRIDGQVTDDQSQELAASDGVDVVSSLSSRRSNRIEFGSGVGIVTVLSVDDRFAGLLDTLPDPIDTRPLDELFTASDEIPVLLDPVVAKRAFRDTIVLNVGQENITLRIVGTFEAPVKGFERGPFIYVPLDALNARLDNPITANTTFVSGPGADAAAARAGIDPADTLSRAGWLRDQRSLALVAGVQSALALSTVLVAALAVIALLATAVAGTRDRARTLSLLRTLGTPSRFGWWLAVSDLAPLVGAALLGGVGAGVLVATLLFRSLGLDALTGGLGVPLVVVAPASVILIAVGAVVLVLVAIVVEVLMHRRDRLNEVLRVGETV